MSKDKIEEKPVETGIRVSVTICPSQHAAMEHAARRRSMTLATYAKMAFSERLEKFGELQVCDGIECNHLCDGKGNIKL